MKRFVSHAACLALMFSGVLGCSLPTPVFAQETAVPDAPGTLAPPSRATLARLRHASVVRVYRLGDPLEVPLDSSRAIGGYPIGAQWPRTAAWIKEVRAAFSKRSSWESTGPSAVARISLVGMRFHDKHGYVDVVVFPRSCTVEIHEDGGAGTSHYWSAQATPLGPWFDWLQPIP